MLYDHILVRYGEISTKGKNRGDFIECLRTNTAYVLRDFKKIKIQAKHDRMYIQLNGEDWRKIAQPLKKVFGIQSFSPVVKVKKDIEAIKESARALLAEMEPTGKTFKVNARRSDKSFPYTSNELNQNLGGYLLQEFPGLRVDLHDPDIELLLEVRNDFVYLTSEVIDGAHGLPVGSGGKAMLMLSGGIDSPVAGYLAMKRGLLLEAVHFASPPFTSEQAKQKVIDLGKILAEVSGQFTIHFVPFTKIQQLIQEKVPQSYTMTITRRMMLRITDEIRKKREGLAIVTGESLGQVASQTLESMFTINEVTNTPIIRPLVTMDKLDIIAIAEKIGTLPISNRPFEDCCTIFTPQRPATKPRRDKANQYEAGIDFAPLIAEAVAGVETMTLKAGQLSEDPDIAGLL
ncbi:MAG: tRNA uracil 4-sulfurtransferase ThiI [Caldibacillus sp.]